MTNMMLANEVAGYVEVARSFEVGDLVVATDYKGREVGGHVTRIASDGSPTVRCSYIAENGTYAGATCTFAASQVRRAI